MKEFFENLDYSWTKDSERLFVTAGNEYKAIFFYVQETGKFSTYRPYFTERKGLNSYLILLTLSGGGTLLYEGKTYEINPGDIFFLDCSKKHRYFTRTHENWDFLWVHFNGATAQGCFRYFYAQNDGPVTKVRSDTCEKIMNELNAVNRHPAIQNDIVSFRLLASLISELFLLGKPTPYSPNTTPKWLLNVLNEVDRRFCSDISLEELAKKFGAHPSVLCKEFKKYFGIGYKNYITAKRIAYAKELLRFSDKSIAEIADETGYQNPEYFIALFKKHEHVTPLSFRKNWRS